MSFAVAVVADTQTAAATIERLTARLQDLGFTQRPTEFKHKRYDSYRAPSALESYVDWIAFDLDVIQNGSDNDILVTVLETVVGQTDPIDHLRPRTTLEPFERAEFDALSRGLLGLGLVSEAELAALN